MEEYPLPTEKCAMTPHDAASHQVIFHINILPTGHPRSPPGDFKPFQSVPSASFWSFSISIRFLSPWGDFKPTGHPRSPPGDFKPFQSVPSAISLGSMHYGVAFWYFRLARYQH
ncbi:hypothetical protein DPMN_040050 [Dreissena polymorpha]|uniref:Uncharacterized protein n=1 Tax=Dreissena polymorpha TaxID=45954 RepID=A0A9D4CUB6_DREPO|nr:hypothetical protein DPMN_040050 [Dreissena polymorpha]